MATWEFRPQRNGSGDGIYDDFVPDGIGVVTASGAVQAQAATTAGQVQTQVVVTGAVQAQAAVTTGQVRSLATITGAVQGQNAVTAGQIVVSLQAASGAVQGQPATTAGQIRSLVRINGAVQGQNATTTGVANPPVTGPFDLKLKLADNVWIDINNHDELTNVSPDDHHREIHPLYGIDLDGVNQHSDINITDTLDLGDVLMWNSSNEWVPFDALDTFVAAGYGGVAETSNPTLPNIDGTPQILPASAGVATTPKAVVQDFANDGLHFAFTGIWTLHISLAIAHDNVNAARTIELQMYNVTEASILASVPVFIGRNQDGTNYGSTIMVEVPAAGLNDLYVLRVVSILGADIVGPVLTNYQFSANLVSQLLVIP